MPLGILSDAEFDRELTKSQLPPPTRLPEIIDVEKGRGQGNNEVPDSLRKIIGEESEINGRKSALDLAKSFGVSPSSVSAYANGSTSTATMDKQPNLNHLNDAKSRVARVARVKVSQAIARMTKEKMDEASLTELAHVAKSLSGVVKDMEPEAPKAAASGPNAPQYIFYSPVVKKEEHYEVVVLRE